MSLGYCKAGQWSDAALMCLQLYCSCMRRSLSSSAACPGLIPLTCRGAVPRLQVRLDITSEEHLHWLNNLERDIMYVRWSRSLLDLLRPMFPGQLARIGKHLYNAVLLVDPASLNSAQCGGPLLSLIGLCVSCGCVVVFCMAGVDCALFCHLSDCESTEVERSCLEDVIALSLLCVSMESIS